MTTMTEVRERPILFSAPMVRAILVGSKVQTRRVVKPQPEHRQVYDWRGKRLHDSEYRVWCYRQHVGADNWDDITRQIGHACPYGQPGDRLWVRETWADVNTDSGPALAYRAGGSPRFCTDDAYPVEYERYPGMHFAMWYSDLMRGEPGHGWRPSIHMPRWASRITLEITDVRVERVQEIGREDAIAEGVWSAIESDRRIQDAAVRQAVTDGKRESGPVEYFRALWDSINGRRGYGWDANPWVWCVSFRRVSP